MIRRLIYSLLLCLPMMAALSGCDKEEIVFDHELPQFETRADAILLEVIMPTATAVDDRIYIVGDFNGGEEAAVGNIMWQLEKAPNSDIKWGIYLNPADFVAGKSLADGYYFYNMAQGPERTVLNEDPVHTENPGLGNRANVWVNRWKLYFDQQANPDEIQHDGYVIYIVDNSGYDEIAMYAWGDAEAFGGWPGMKPTGIVVIDGITYKYFDTGEANKGLNLNLIFNNNNNGKQLADFNVTLDRDYYLNVTADGVEDFDPSQTVKHDGHAVFVLNKTGWADEDVRMYMWGDVNNLNGDWPGMEPTGRQTINGLDFIYFDFGEANTGLNENLIFSNNGASQLGDFNFTIERDLYLELGSSAVEIDPENYGGGSGETPVEPDPEPQPEPKAYTLYLENLTGWSSLYVYAWGTGLPELFGGWPGSASEGTVSIAGRTFDKFTMVGAGEGYNLILNDNNGTQYDAAYITVDRDYYFTASASAMTELTAADLQGNYRIYLDDQTGWETTSLYAWGSVEYFGGWPGRLPDGTETIGGVTYKYWNISGFDESENLIFNNNNNGSQLGDYNVTFNRDYYLKATPEGVTAK